MLSKNVNSFSVFLGFLPGNTSAYEFASDVSLRPFTLCSPDFPPQRFTLRRPHDLLRHYYSILCYYSHVSDQLDSTKFHVLDEKKKKLIPLFFILFLLIFIPILSWYYNFALNRPAQNFERTIVEIKSGESLSDIAAKLYAKDLINSQGLFLFYVVTNNLGATLKPGVYSIPIGTSLKDLVSILQQGTKQVKITFLEGWRVEQFALQAAKNLKLTNYEDFVLQASSLEGYLFPDTYFVKYDITTEDLIDLLSRTFEEKTSSILEKKTGLAKDFSDEELIVIASLVEREARSDEDRAIVAGIIMNRLKLGMYLGVDATNQYYVPFLRANCPERLRFKCFSYEEALEVDWWPADMTGEELAFDSPYNTRKRLGLPPTPISSFGVSSLKATTNPLETDYLYYLSDKSGAMVYAVSMEDHTKNIIQYLR